MTTTAAVSNTDVILLEGVHRTLYQLLAAQTGTVGDRALDLLDKTWRDLVRVILGTNVDQNFLVRVADHGANADIRTCIEASLEWAAQRFANSDMSDRDLLIAGFVPMDRVIHTRALEIREATRAK